MTRTEIQNRKLGCVLVFSFALLVRLIYFYHQTKNPFSSVPISDSITYILEAEKILSGNWLGNQIYTFGGGAFYTYFLAGIFAFFGKSFLVVQITQHLFGAISCTVIFLISLKYYGYSIGIILGLWTAIFTPFLFHEGLLLSSAPAILFLILSLYFLLLSRDSTASSGAKALSAGLFLGLSVLCRPNALLLAPVYLFWIIDWSKPLIKNRASLALVLGLALTILPVTLRNYIVGDDLVLISSGGGLNFFIGNNRSANGIFHIPPEIGVQNDYTMCFASDGIGIFLQKISYNIFFEWRKLQCRKIEEKDTFLRSVLKL